jgi:superfamily I DNA/RNA helicase
MIRTNYRCEPEIVEAANRLMTHQEGQIPMEARANPKKPRGRASIRVFMPTNRSEGGHLYY